jgi:diguanylate cyclase (GGDEF)-like protein/PAS domain S-box-containing protein
MSVRGQLKILLLEDVATDAELASRQLQRAGIECTTRRVQTEEAFVHMLDEFRPDLILSDFTLPAFDGLTALDIARKKRPDTPFIFVSGTLGEERAIESLRRGAVDYVLKTNLRRLAPAVQRAMQDVEERNERRKAEQQLQDSEARFQIVARATNDAIWDWDLVSGQVWWNESTRTLFGYSPEEIGSDASWWMERIHPDDKERVLAEIYAVIEGEGNFWSGEYRFLRAYTDYAHVLDRGYAVRDASGKAYRMIGAMMDITERKKQEVKIARLSRIHAVLSGINSAIVRVRDRAELFREACRIAVEHGGFRLAWVGLIDKETSEIRPVAWMGQENGFLRDLRLSARADTASGQGISGIAVRTGKPVVVNDVATDDRLRHAEETLRHGFRSFVVLPLTLGPDPVGLLALYADEPFVFDHEELKLLIELSADISFALDHIAKTDQLDYLAYYDGLTGLPNRTLFYDRVGQLVHAALGKESVATFMLDLERFRTINETLGVAAGDVVLKQLAARLAAVVPEPGTVARLSADCFAVAVGGIRDVADVAYLLEKKLIAALAPPFIVDAQELHIPVKAGVALYPGDGRDVGTLCTNAEAALKNAKRRGERFLFYAPQMNARVAERLTLENQLRIAMQEEQFILYYQPKIDLATGGLSGMEALLRWASPELGLVSPDRFIPILEETGMILDIGRWALRKAISDHAGWCARGMVPPRVAVNVSVIQLRQEQFVADVRNAVESGGTSGRHIDLEITESMIMEDIAGSIQKLAEIRALGVGVSLDDFGTGYSSLSHIAKLPVNTLKIDQSFIAAMSESSEHMAIVSAVISLARALNMKVVAEGVETQEQSNLLRLLRCDEAQGYLFNPALAPEMVERLFVTLPGAAP